MDRLSTLATFAVVGVVLLTSGCISEVYRAETVLKADGGVSRAIYQPIKATPDEALKPGKWSRVTYARRVKHQQWIGKIADLPSTERSDNNYYFAAWGEFKSPDELPQAFVKKAPEGLPDGKLVVDYQREELGLVVAYRWQETLTDIVTIDDMHEAREELADVLIPLGQKIFDRALGEEYDTTKLFDWFQQTGQPWAFEMIDASVAQTDVEKQLLGRSVLDTREALVNYVELVRSNEELRRAMAACVAEKSTAPLYEGPKDRSFFSESETMFTAMRRLLKLPE